MKRALFYLLCFTTLLLPVGVKATSIVALWTPERIVIAADSRLSPLVDGTYSQVCKIRAEGNLWYATAGLYEAPIDGFNISNIIHEAYSKARHKDNIVSFAMTELSFEVAKRLNAVRERVDVVLRNNPNLNLAELILVAKEKDGFKAVYNQTDISRLMQSTNAMAFDGEIGIIPENRNAMQILVAGRKDAILEYIASNPAWAKGDDLVAIAHKFIQMEIDRYPMGVGGPISILAINKDGTVKWEDPGLCEVSK